MARLPRIGDHVRVRMGATVVEAEVLDAYDWGMGVHVMVSIPLTGTDEHLTNTLPVELVELVEAA